LATPDTECLTLTRVDLALPEMALTELVLQQKAFPGSNVVLDSCFLTFWRSSPN
jgi:hypothetical protein